MAKVIDKKLQEQLAKARANYEMNQIVEPRVMFASFDEVEDKIVITLNNSASFAVPRHLLQGLRDADPQQVKQVKVTPLRDGLFWEELDVHINVPALLQGVFGTKAWMNMVRKELAKLGGQSKSDAKAKAARENGKKGGRPRTKEAKS